MLGRERDPQKRPNNVGKCAGRRGAGPWEGGPAGPWRGPTGPKGGDGGKLIVQRAPPCLLYMAGYSMKDNIRPLS